MSIRVAGELVAIAADEARATAFNDAADWLMDKHSKATCFPGGDLKHADGRAAAYWNAATHFRLCADTIRKRMDEDEIA